MSHWINFRRWLARLIYAIAAWIDVPYPISESTGSTSEFYSFIPALPSVEVLTPEHIEPIVIVPVETLVSPQTQPVEQPEAVADMPTPSMTDAKVYHWHRGHIEERSGVSAPSED